jgi:carbonic anhydrase/acetyltransferase-like protein (isoleucine patch superfamily)
VTFESREFIVHPDMVGRMLRVGPAMIADNAVVVGDVRLGEDVNIWFGVTIRGDDSWIEIGADTNVQDNTVVHVDVDAPQRIGRGVTIGHGVVLHGVEVGDYSLLGMNCTVLGGARIGAYSLIGAGAVVQEGAVIPPRSVVLGVPGRVQSMRWRAGHYVLRARSYLR